MICPNKYVHIEPLKNHIFMRHSEYQVLAKYKRPIEQLVGQEYLARCRAPLLKKILEGSFEKFLRMMVDPMRHHGSAKICRALPIFEDLDPVNQKLRLEIYQLKRELLLRIIPEVEGVPNDNFR